MSRGFSPGRFSGMAKAQSWWMAGLSQGTRIKWKTHKGVEGACKK